MWSNWLADAGEPAGLLAGQFHRRCADGAVGEVAWKEPVPGLTHSPPSAQDLQQCGREHDLTIFLPFALIDTNDHALAIDVGRLQSHHFGDAQTGSVTGS